MASIKNSIVGGVVRRLGHAARVVEVENLSPRVRRIRFEAADPVALAFKPGMKIKLQVAPGVLRSYTPSRWTADGLEVIVHLHGNGPASAWAASLEGGEETSFMGPGKSIRGFDEAPAWALFLGDETTIGLAQALFEALPATTTRLGAIELAASDRGALASLDLGLHEAVRGPAHGDALVAWLEATELPAGDGAIWISGEAGSVLALRNALAARGYSRPQVRVKPYWSVQGHAHRKTLEKQGLTG